MPALLSFYGRFKAESQLRNMGRLNNSQLWAHTGTNFGNIPGKRSEMKRAHLVLLHYRGRAENVSLSGRSCTSSKRTHQLVMNGPLGTICVRPHVGTALLSALFSIHGPRSTPFHVEFHPAAKDGFSGMVTILVGEKDMSDFLVKGLILDRE